jgi:UDP-N-acetylglucosamine acyltransferase
MPHVHPTAIIGSEVELADDVRIGPHCVLEGPIRIGAGTRLVGNVYVHGPAEIGERNTIYPFACLGFASQHRGIPDDFAGAGIRIGNDNVLRESVTIHRATQDEHPTSLGDHGYLMVGVHLGHDAAVGDWVTFANMTMLGGHAVVEDRVIMAGSTAIHQFSRVGAYAMTSGNTVVTCDLPPFVLAVERNTAAGLNLVGMRRNDFTRSEINDAKWAYRVIFRSGLVRPTILDELQTRAPDSRVVRMMHDFVRDAKRSLPVDRQRGKQAAHEVTTES